MINFIQGTIIENGNDYQVIALNNQFYLNISVPLTQRKNQGEIANLYTHLHWNQETGPSLYGFESKDAKLVFMLLIECNGIGPKAALSILNQADSSNIITAIAEKNSNFLSSLSGIGAKKAEQIILSLHSKVTKIINDGIINLATGQTYINDLISVLQSLSYSKTEVDQALNYLRSLENKPAGFDEALRKTLSFLTTNK
jgi:Holliday junction DNA helicase RuvA